MRLFEGTEWDIPPKCDRCGELESDCQCEPIAPGKDLVDPSKQTARLQIEKRKKGKVVTVIRGLLEANNELDEILKKLKSACGAGGTTKEHVIQIQGKHLERVRETLEKIGFCVKG